MVAGAHEAAGAHRIAGSRGSPWGARAPAVQVTVGLLVKAMEASGWEDGRYLVDGFPRSVDNWEGWCRVVGSRVRVRFAIALECSEEVMEARLLERGKTSGRAAIGNVGGEPVSAGRCLLSVLAQGAAPRLTSTQAAWKSI